MNPPSVDIRDYLESSASGAGLTAGTDLFVGVMPASPDACVCLADLPGLAPATRYVLEYPMLQALVRGAKAGYDTAWAQAADVRDALHKLTDETINSTRYIQILCESDIGFLGMDENNRPLFSVNFHIQRTA